MKVIINDMERGFFFKDGRYVKLLMPGKYIAYGILGRHIQKVSIKNFIDASKSDTVILLNDPEFVENTERIDVPDGHIAVHSEDGHIVNTFYHGTYFFWNGYCRHTFEIIDLSKPEITQFTPEQLMSVPKNMYCKIEVPEGETGLLMYNGKYIRQLESSIYYFWNSMTKVTCQTVDMRSQQLEVSGQEILTADKVSLRLNFICTYRITDAVKIINEIKDHKTQIYTLTQLALREYVGGFRFDELLEQKDTIASFVLEQLKKKQSSLFIEFSDAGLKDIILPGEIREIMNTVLIAEKNAQANVISRREEVASTRSLLNTAKLMDENTTLYKLKELEYLEKICDRVGNISVGGGNLLGELRDLVGSKSK